MKPLVRLSVGFNIVFCILLAVLALFFVKQNLEFSYYESARPKGSIIKTERDFKIYSRSDGTSSFTLPKGTTLQESTSQGFATLGKFYGRDYLLIIHSPAADFTSNEMRDRSLDWVDAYSFSPHDPPF